MSTDKTKSSFFSSDLNLFFFGVDVGVLFAFAGECIEFSFFSAFSRRFGEFTDTVGADFTMVVWVFFTFFFLST